MYLMSHAPLQVQSKSFFEMIKVANRDKYVSTPVKNRQRSFKWRWLWTNRYNLCFQAGMPDSQSEYYIFGVWNNILAFILRFNGD